MTNDGSSAGEREVAKPKRRILRNSLMGFGLVAVLVLGIGAAGAQWGGWRDGWHHRGAGHERSHREGRFEDRRARLERFCANDNFRYHTVVRAFAKADLRLNDTQAREFDHLVDLVVPALEEIKREACNNFVSARGGPTPEKVAHLASVLRKAADAAERAVEPTRKFYASLNEQQQARVDELAERRRARRWGR